MQTRKWPVSEFTFNGITYKSTPGDQEYNPGYIKGNGNMGVYSYGYEARNSETGSLISFKTDYPSMFEPGTYLSEHYTNPFPYIFEGSIFTISFITQNGLKYYFKSVTGYEFHVSNSNKGYPEVQSNDMLFELRSTTDPDIDTTIFYKIPFIIRTHMENPY